MILWYDLGAIVPIGMPNSNPFGGLWVLAVNGVGYYTATDEEFDCCAGGTLTYMTGVYAGFEQHLPAGAPSTITLLPIGDIINDDLCICQNVCCPGVALPTQAPLTFTNMAPAGSSLNFSMLLKYSSCFPTTDTWIGQFLCDLNQTTEPAYSGYWSGIYQFISGFTEVTAAVMLVCATKAKGWQLAVSIAEPFVTFFAGCPSFQSASCSPFEIVTNDYNGALSGPMYGVISE